MAGYYEGFEDWKSIQSKFSMAEEEPDEVLAAVYEQGDYEGDAMVIYRRGNQFYTNSGGHCSCYGLEGQWNPEQYDRDTLIAAIKRGDGYGATKTANAVALSRLQSNT